MGKVIVDIDPREMSFIFSDYKGEKWQPVNGDARVLSVKGIASGVIAAIKKAYFPAGEDAAVDSPAMTYPVSEDVPDNIDGDGDGSADYSCYALAICYAAADINQACGLQEPARSQAIVAIIDKFRSEAQSQFGESEKAGARHSQADAEHLAAIQDAVTKQSQIINEHLSALGVGEDADSEPEDEPNDDQKTDEEDVASDKGSQEVEYADPENKKYPVDTEKHVRAAWSYINMEKNAKVYSDEDLAKVKARIIAAGKKFGIEFNVEGKDEKAAVVEGESLVDVIKAEAQVLIAEKTAEIEQQLVTAKAEAEARIETIESRAVQLETQLQEVTARAEKAELTIKAMVQDARTPSSPGFVPTLREDGKHDDPAAESTKAQALQQLGSPTKIADVIKLQRLAQ